MNDLISRQAAIRFKVSHGINESGVLYVPYGEVKKYLKQLPSVQPEVTAEMVESYIKPRCLRVISEEFYLYLTSGKYQPPPIFQPEIIRCTDCKHYLNGFCVGLPINSDDATSLEMSADDYCSYGERRGEE